MSILAECAKCVALPVAFAVVFCVLLVENRLSSRKELGRNDGFIIVLRFGVGILETKFCCKMCEI